MGIALLMLSQHAVTHSPRRVVQHPVRHKAAARDAQAIARVILFTIRVLSHIDFPLYLIIPPAHGYPRQGPETLSSRSAGTYSHPLNLLNPHNGLRLWQAVSLG